MTPFSTFDHEAPQSIVEYASGKLNANSNINNVNWMYVPFVNHISKFPNSWSSDRYTIQNDGVFCVSANVLVYNSNDNIFQLRMRIYQNSVIQATSSLVVGAAYVDDDLKNANISRQTILNCSAGDTISVMVYAHFSGSTVLTYNTDSGRPCEVTIIKID